jgi:hypothetical protein
MVDVVAFHSRLFNVWWPNLKYWFSYQSANTHAFKERKIGREYRRGSKRVQQNSRQSIPGREQELGLSQTSIWRILSQELGLHPYKVQLT